MERRKLKHKVRGICYYPPHELTKEEESHVKVWMDKNHLSKKHATCLVIGLRSLTICEKEDVERLPGETKLHNKTGFWVLSKKRILAFVSEKDCE